MRTIITSSTSSPVISTSPTHSAADWNSRCRSAASISPTSWRKTISFSRRGSSADPRTGLLADSSGASSSTSISSICSSSKSVTTPSCTTVSTRRSKPPPAVPPPPPPPPPPPAARGEYVWLWRRKCTGTASSSSSSLAPSSATIACSVSPGPATPAAAPPVAADGSPAASVARSCSCAAFCLARCAFCWAMAAARSLGFILPGACVRMKFAAGTPLRLAGMRTPSIMVSLPSVANAPLPPLFVSGDWPPCVLPASDNASRLLRARSVFCRRRRVRCSTAVHPGSNTAPEPRPWVGSSTLVVYMLGLGVVASRGSPVRDAVALALVAPTCW